jgi:hypothetical protein
VVMKKFLKKRREEVQLVMRLLLLRRRRVRRLVRRLVWLVMRRRHRRRMPLLRRVRRGVEMRGEGRMMMILLGRGVMVMIEGVWRGGKGVHFRKVVGGVGLGFCR